MKRLLFLLIIIIGIAAGSRCQNIGINATGALPHPSAMLDVSAFDKGMLVPRTSTTSRMAIVNPAKGLLLYDTTTNSFWYNSGSSWAELSSGTTGSGENFWNKNGNNIYTGNTGNVGIGTNSPTSKLTLQTPLNAEGFRHVGGSDSIIVSEAIGGVSAAFGTASNHAFRLMAGGQGRMSFYPNGEVVIGDNSAASFGKLSVATMNNSYGISHLGEGGNILATRMGGNSAGIGTFSNTNMRIFSNNQSAIFINASNGYVGVGVNNDLPSSKFQIGTINDPELVGQDFAIGNNGKTLGIYQGPDATLISSSTDVKIISASGRGNIGINTANVTNKLQVGDLGNSGFAGNNFATGNGINAMAIYQDDHQTLIGSTTDIVLKPRNNGQGRVGINTNTPRAPLDVTGVSTPLPAGIQYSYMNEIAYNNGIGQVSTGSGSGVSSIANISIIASGNVYANEFDAYSDARIKEVGGQSDAHHDLAVLNALQVTDYTMKDKVVYGNKQYKKLIAQEVEKVYPQIVSKHTDFIPNVYRLTSHVKKLPKGYLLTFSGAHHLSSQATELQAVTSDSSSMQTYDILSIPSDDEVIIDGNNINADKIFVYGEEVADFRTVDYEGLTTLTISALQEVSRIVKIQAAAIDKLKRQLRAQQSIIKKMQKASDPK